jgi:hypothetical protein
MQPETEDQSVPPRVNRAPNSRQAAFLVGLCAVFVLTIYVWLISVGTWIHWPTHWSAYDSLATAFRHGQLSVEAVPDPGLLALPDPYDPAARQDIPYLQDFSLYKGRYYLYFGPVPALGLAVVKSFIPGPIGDQYLTFAFVAGIFFLQSFLIVTIRKKFFPDASPWTLVPAVLVAGLMIPWTWILSTPSIYNASITAGQFFFLAAFLAAFSAFGQSPVSTGRLLFSALLWVAAIGSRITLIFPVAFMALFITICIALQYRRAPAHSSGSLHAMLALSTPLALGLAGLAWYNWARFDSVFETGFKYQLGGLFKQAHLGELFWPGYIVQNLYNYWLTPPGLKYPFPYLFPSSGLRESLIPFIKIPEIYHVQEITGLLYGAPFLVLALLPVFGLLHRVPANLAGDERAQLFKWLVTALAGSFVFGSALFLAFFWAAERYIVDFLPSLLLLSLIGMWQLDRRLAFISWGRTAYWIALSFLMAASILVSFLLSLSFNSDAFRHLNPLLWRQLSNLFRP